MWARIKDGLVAETTDVDPEGRYVPELVWQETEQAVQVGWTFDGTTFAPPDEPTAAVNARLSPLHFMERFTAEESTGIAAAVVTSPAVMLWMLKTAAAKEIDLTDQLTIDGLEALVTAGLLTEARKTALLTP